VLTEGALRYRRSSLDVQLAQLDRHRGANTMSQPQMFEGAANVPPKPRAKLQGVWLYLAILATVYVVATQSNARKIEQLQMDTNDNLCNQQAYGGGTTCEGGDANG
jgi:hypothetical protein